MATNPVSNDAAAEDPYPKISEQPGSRATPEQLSMLMTRYELAGRMSEGLDALEAACGAGMGLSYIAAKARRVVGGDFSPTLIQAAGANLTTPVPLVSLDAQSLPFGDGTFDVVICYEALYYFERFDRFLQEAHRVLRPAGKVVICSANPERPGFVKSPHSHRYFSASGLDEALKAGGFSTELFGAFPAAEQSAKGMILSLARRAAVGLNLIPTTLKGRALLKRLIYGKLQEMDNEITADMAPVEPLVAIDEHIQPSTFKVIYAIGSRDGQA